MSGFYNRKSSGGSSLSILYDGVELGVATSIDFTGAGQTTTILGSAVTVDIPGGSGATPFVESPSGVINSSNVTFTLTHTPLANTLTLTYGTALTDPADYTISGTTITTTYALDPGNTLVASYSY